MPNASLRFIAAGLAVLALAGGAVQAAAPAVSFTTEAGAQILNAPMLPQVCHGSPLGGDDICVTPPLQVNGHLDGTATSDAEIIVVSIDLVGDVAGEDTGESELTCADESRTACDWTYFPHWPLPPGDYTATATVLDADGATATATLSITIL